MISVALIAATAIVVGFVGIPWGAWPVIVTSALTATAILAVRTMSRSRSVPPDLIRDPPLVEKFRFWHREGSDGVHSGLALAVGMGVAVAIGWLTVVLAFGPVDSISPTYDAVYHYSAITRILATSDGSSLTLGELTTPGQPSTYPAAWHDLVALVVLTSGSTIPVASNLVAFAVAAIVWPLSCALLVRQMLGRHAGAVLLAPILATAFTAMPWMVMTWGVLWPNLLGLALVPTGLAAGVTALGLTCDSIISRPGGLLLGTVAIPTLGLAHPNAAVSLLVLLLSPVVYGAVIATYQRVRQRQLLAALTALAVASAAVFAVVWLLAWSPFLASVRAFDWPASMGRREAILGVLWNGMNERPELIVVSALVIIGAVFALRSPLTGWLVPAHLTSGFLYVLAVSREDALTSALTGAWYNDSYRIAAMVPITGVPLATLGVVGTVGVLIRAGSHLRRAKLTTDRRRTLTTQVVAVAALVLILASDGFRVGVHAFVVAGTYQRQATWMLQPGQREFLDEAGRLLPPDAIVAANPWTGNVLLYPLTGQAVMFPHMAGRWTPDQQVIRQRLRDAGSDPSVCAAVRATGLTHAIDGPVSYWPWDKRSRTFPGITDLNRAPGFEPIISGGGSTLYRITACDTDSAQNSG